MCPRDQLGKIVWAIAKYVTSDTTGFIADGRPALTGGTASSATGGDGGGGCDVLALPATSGGRQLTRHQSEDRDPDWTTGENDQPQAESAWIKRPERKRPH